MNRLRPTVLALAGCVAEGGDEGDAALVLRNNLAPDGTACELSPETTAPFVSRGADRPGRRSHAVDSPDPHWQRSPRLSNVLRKVALVL